MQWDTQSASFRLSPDNKRRIQQKLCRALATTSYTHRLWESLMGSLFYAALLMESLFYAAEVLPLGRLWHRGLMLKGRRVFPITNRDLVLPMPPVITKLLHPWAKLGRLDTAHRWTDLPPSLYVTTDASDWGWGFQW